MGALLFRNLQDSTAPELEIYSGASETELKRYYEPEPGLFIAESPNVILRALAAGYAPVSFLLEEEQLKREDVRTMLRCAETAADREIPVYLVPEEKLRQLTGYPMTRGALCGMRRKRLPAPEVLCGPGNAGRPVRRVAVLENVMNPTNVGAIFRSAAAMKMDAVLLTRGCSDPLYRRAARVSMGTVFQIPWTYLPAQVPYIPLLHEMGFRTAAMALTENTISIDDPRLLEEERLAVILGTEGEGLCDETIAGSTYAVKIPMAAGVDSLNVAAASAVAFYVLGNRS